MAHTASPAVHVNRYIQEDFAASYHFHNVENLQWFDGITVTVGVDNAFNENMPFSSGAFPDTYGDVGKYNGAIGRMYYLDCDYKF